VCLDDRRLLLEATRLWDDSWNLLVIELLMDGVEALGTLQLSWLRLSESVE